MFYIQTTANHGYIYILLPGKDEWSAWEITYSIDAHFEVKDSKAKLITVDDLPESLTITYDFSQQREHIRKVYDLRTTEK